MANSIQIAHPMNHYAAPEWGGPAETSSPTDGGDGLAADPVDVVTAGLSPDALMAYCQSRLDSIDGQARASLDSQRKNAATITQIDSVIAQLKEHEGGDTTDPGVIKQMETTFGDLITSLKESDPGCAALPALTKAYNSMVFSGDGGATYAKSPGGPDFIDADKYPVEGTPPKGDGKIGDAELQGYVQALTDAAGNLNSDSELQMVQLQSLMSQRQTAVSLTTNLVQSLGDQENKIAENIGH